MKAVDLFAGFGGFTLGAEQAGAHVVWAGNHWPTAVEAHAANHPHTEHVCQDLRQADWSALPDYELLLASPACQGHSRASRSKRRPKHDADRSSAWAVIECAEVTEPRAVIVENVLELMTWILYPLWREALVRLGYHVEERIEVATDYGVPQRRTRVFIVATKKPQRLRLTRRAEEPAFGPQIEDTVDGWKPITEAKPGASARMLAAQKRTGSRILVQHVTNHPGVPLTEPIRTITTCDHWVLADGDMYRPLTIREYARAMGFPDGYTWPDHVSRRATIRGLGGAVPPPMACGVVAAVLEAA